MTVLSTVIRTAIVYIVLVGGMKLLGKRQVGELQLSELVTTLLVSELATAPILEEHIHFSVPLTAFAVILALEYIISLLMLKLPSLRSFFEGTPNTLFHDGCPDMKELRKARITLEELLSELRLQGAAEPEQVFSATLESNGKLSVVLKSEYRPLCASDLGINMEETGTAHTVICAGKLNENELKLIGKNRNWIDKKLKKLKLKQEEIILFTVTDNGRSYLVPKNGKVITDENQ